MRPLLILFSLLLGAPAAGAVELTLVTEKGYVRFSVPDEWAVLKAQTKPPVSAMAFQVANPADDGTPHSTNVVVSLFDTSTEQGKAAAARVGKPYGPVQPQVRTRGDWTVYSQSASQHGATYHIVDAVRNAADVVVLVRFAWPCCPTTRRAMTNP
jgi:hypothetical protein